MNKEQSLALSKQQWEIGQYRNKGSEEMAKRLADPYRVGLSLRITVNIDQSLKKGGNSILDNRGEEFANNLQNAIDQQIPFILFSDPQHYACILPKEKYVACFVNGEMMTKEVLIDDLQFQNRVKIAVVVYDKFYLPEKGWVEEQKLIEEYERTK